jgi:hypothetical protein
MKDKIKNNNLLSEPPKDLLSYENQNEVLNFILDKAFV